MKPAPIFLLRGSDAVLLSEACTQTVAKLVAGGDRSLMVDEFSGSDYPLAAVVDAANTPPFLTERRVVVMRHGARFSKADDLASLLDYLRAPSPTTSMVVVWEKAPEQTQQPTVPKKLVEAVQGAGGEVVLAEAPTGKARGAWLEDRFAEAAVKLDAPARALVVNRVGEDLRELSAIFDRLAAAYGEGARLGSEEVEPFLGEAGAVPPWELTDAIDRGDAARAIERLHRMLRAGERHALQMMATLQTHYTRMLRLDGAPVRSEREAAELLGIRGSTFPARKALEQARRLGHGGVARAVTLLAQADVDLRGAQAWPPELVLEVLVARLARLSAASRR